MAEETEFKSSVLLPSLSRRRSAAESPVAEVSAWVSWVSGRSLPGMRVEALSAQAAAGLKDAGYLFACSSFLFLAMREVAVLPLATILQPEFAQQRFVPAGTGAGRTGLPAIPGQRACDVMCEGAIFIMAGAQLPVFARYSGTGSAPFVFPMCILAHGATLTSTILPKHAELGLVKFAQGTILPIVALSCTGQ